MPRISTAKKSRAAFQNYPAILMNAEAAAEYLGVPVGLIALLPLPYITLEAEPLYRRSCLSSITKNMIKGARCRKEILDREQKGWVRSSIPAELSRAVYDRDGRICAYCLTTEGPFHLDHKLPVSRGGTNDPDNLTVACNQCNTSKGAKTLDAWLAGDKFRTKRGPGRNQAQ